MAVEWRGIGLGNLCTYPHMTHMDAGNKHAERSHGGGDHGRTKTGLGETEQQGEGNEGKRDRAARTAEASSRWDTWGGTVSTPPVIPAFVGVKMDLDNNSGDVKSREATRVRARWFGVRRKNGFRQSWQVLHSSSFRL